MQPNPHKTRSTLPRLQKRCSSMEKGGRWDLRPDAFSSGAEMLIPEARARTYVSICVWGGVGGRGSLISTPIHTRQASIWTLMSPHMSGLSVAANRIQTQQRLPAANLPLSASPSWLGGMGGVTKQAVPYIVLHMACRVSQQLEMKN